MSLDHDRIRDEEDRSLTPALIQTILSIDPDTLEWSQAAETIRQLEDYRSVQPLKGFIEDRGRPAQARGTIARTLAAFDLTTTPGERARWWRSGDAVLAEHALRLMGRPESAVVVAVAADHQHPLQAVALETLEWGFEEPEFQAVKVQGLTSSRSEVRVAAAYTVSWDEPLSGELPLRDLLVDIFPEVATAAAYALQYFPSLATLSHLRRHAARLHPAAEPQRAESVKFIEGNIQGVLAASGPVAQAQLHRWSEAIDFTAGEDNGPAGHLGRSSAAPTPELDPIGDPARLDDALDTSTGSFREKARLLRSVDWPRVPDRDRDRIGQRLAEHPDPEVRSIATVPLGRWNQSSRLVALVDDQHAGVSKSAMYELVHIEHDLRIATLARDTLDSRAGTQATEALATFARHAAPQERDAFLFDLAVADRRTGVQSAAVTLLATAGANTRLRRLTRLLGRPPTVNWAFHNALLATDAAAHADPAHLHALIDVDNLHVAAAAARAFEARPTP